MQKAVERHGATEYLRSDNGSEFIAKIVQRWLKANRIKTIYIEPGSPWQNGFVQRKHKFKPVLGLTPNMVQKVEPGQYVYNE